MSKMHRRRQIDRRRRPKLEALEPRRLPSPVVPAEVCATRHKDPVPTTPGTPEPPGPNPTSPPPPPGDGTPPTSGPSAPGGSGEPASHQRSHA